MVRRVLVVWLLMVLGPFAAWGAPAHAAGAGHDGTLTVLGSVNGRAVTSLDNNSPLRMDPDHNLRFDLKVTNSGTQAVEVPKVRFHGRVLGLTFFNFTVQVGLIIPPGATQTASFELALDGLGAQATGLLEAELTLMGTSGALLDETFPVDVRGDARSTYGMFALGVAVLTAVLVVGLLLRLATRRLPTSRWSRACLFMVPGGGLGLTLSVGLSVARVLVPTSDRSITLLAGGFVVGFALGYLSPSQDDDGDPEALYDDDVVDLREQIFDLDSSQARSETASGSS